MLLLFYFMSLLSGSEFEILHYNSPKCYFNGAEYEEGAVFYPNCRIKCYCIHGSIGCYSRCNQIKPLHCLRPRKVKSKIKSCCPTWRCAEKKARVSLLRHKKTRKIRNSKIKGFFTHES